VVLAMLAPAVAMNFTAEVRWTRPDFLVAGLVLPGGAALCELFAWRVRNGRARIVFAAAIVAAVCPIWMWAVA